MPSDQGHGNSGGSGQSGGKPGQGGGNPGQGGGNPGQGGGNPGQGGGNPGGDHPPHFEIQIDRVKYEVTQSVMTGAELRRVPAGGIPADRDLFEVVPGGPDRKIGDNDKVEIRSGKRFFTAPGQINPGAV